MRFCNLFISFQVQKEIERLSYKLVQLNESLAQRIAAREDYDRLIAETEAGYVKVICFM